VDVGDGDLGLILPAKGKKNYPFLKVGGGKKPARHSLNKRPNESEGTFAGGTWTRIIKLLTRW